MREGHKRLGSVAEMIGVAIFKNNLNRKGLYSLQTEQPTKNWPALPLGLRSSHRDALLRWPEKFRLNLGLLGRFKSKPRQPET